MTTEEKEAVKTLAQKFWANPKNVREFRKVEAEIRKDIDSRMLGKPVTTVEESIARRKAVGIPIYTIEGEQIL